MSFYGSTYFQLIDTFYKILIKNKGNNAVTFPIDLSASEHASQASGRKGILEFGTGNRWIYATQDSNNPNSYVFWHAAPGGKTLSTLEFKGGAKGDVSLPTGKTAITLAPGSYIKAPQFKFDEAGHIAAADDVYYMMPISETEEAIEDLQAKVGEPSDGKTDDLFTRAKNADEAIAEVTETADKLRDELGTYSRVFPETGTYDYVSGTNYYKDFFSTFGSMDAFRQSLYDDQESSKTLIDGILEFRSSALEDIENNASNIGNQARLLNTTVDRVDVLEDEVENLHNKDGEIDTAINTVSTNLTNTAKAIRQEFADADDQIKASLKSHTDTYDTRIANIEASIKSNSETTDTRIQGLDAKITANKAACDSAVSTINANATRLEGLISDNTTDITNLTKTVEDNKTSAENAAAGLSDRIEELETNSATTAQLDATNVIVGENTSAIASLGDEIEQVNENASTSIQNLQSQITTINGTITTQNGNIANKADSATVTALESKVDNHISANETALTSKADKSTVEALQATVNDKANSSTVTELANLVATKANQSELTTLSELVNTKATQESVNDLAAAVDSKAGLDAFEKYMSETDAKIQALEQENSDLRGLIEALTARVEALENPVTE